MAELVVSPQVGAVMPGTGRETLPVSALLRMSPGAARVTSLILLYGVGMEGGEARIG